MPVEENLSITLQLNRFLEGLAEGALSECGCPGCRTALLVALSMDMAEVVEDDNKNGWLFCLAHALAKP